MIRLLLPTLFVFLLTACGGTSKPVMPDVSRYCLNSGKAGEYSCSPEVLTQTAKPTIYEGPTLNDEQLRLELAEIKAWLREEREAILNGETRPTAAGPMVTTVSATLTLPDKQLEALPNEATLSEPNSHQEYETSEDSLATTTSASASTHNTTDSLPNPGLSQASVSEVERISQLQSIGDHRRALAGMNIYLASNPADPTAQLRKVLLLQQMGRSVEAEKLLARLIQTAQ